ncbi:hypothetical protein ETH_00020825 [Eimeria tenella]|uniref:Uncharacterized protein n=1 Tax=Eimeria tenella TaxID=5802 RepID=U6KWD7_EIMTE|nr:hypothetical protein ETH_00020825 [Eimeria tenella]CDJ42417.1 hypothetical protein ETH_00020825 [Eimeria tenella]|eukprot:XP_013233167.1 hypothetical protein ETH_00020825 [Eimeria tenella]
MQHAEMDGKLQRICTEMPSKEPPTEFYSVQGDEHLATWEIDIVQFKLKLQRALHAWVWRDIELGQIRSVYAAWVK